MKPADDGNGEVIDQDAVNDLIDYALAHGINYFDTALLPWTLREGYGHRPETASAQFLLHSD